MINPIPNLANYQSWGRYPQVNQKSYAVSWGHEDVPFADLPGTVLAYGQGRSYGDSCLNADGTLLDTAGLNRFIAFDPERGVLQCEAGTTLADILPVIAPHGWFLPVTPGTQFVSIGGAIANDVHGKNHHQAGTFGCYVRQFELLRSDGSRLVCSPSQHPQLFAATIGGLGLTGLIVWAEIQLTAIPGPWIAMEILKFDNLDEFLSLTADSDTDYAYTVSWVDCFASGDRLGRGLFMRGNFTAEGKPRQQIYRRTRLNVPVDIPAFVLNAPSLKAFNWLYYHKQSRRWVKQLVAYPSFFYPLDAIANWNRLYGKRGFFQHQCVVPFSAGKAAIAEILARIAARRLGAFLAVLKTFGSRVSPGLLSFPRPGITLTLDFPNQGQATFQLLDELDQIVRECGGAVYPAKDARMSARNFQAYFPQWRTLATYRDPKFSSSFWRRVTNQT